MTWTPPQLAPVVLDRLAPWLTPESDPYGDHAKFLTAASAMGQPLWGLVMDSGDDPDDPSWVPGWGALFDVDICPFAYLPFLAQVVGVPASALVGADDATARQIIRAEQGQQRGTPGAVLSAAQRNLIGTQSAVLQERTAADGSADPYHFVLVVRPEEAQSTNGVVNPSFEYDTEGSAPAAWTAHGTNTLTVLNAAAASAPAFSGSLMMECLYGNDLRLASINTASYIAGETRTISAYVWIPAGWNGGQITLTNDNGGTRGDFTLDGGAGSGPIDANMALTNQWQRLATAIVAGGSGFTGGVFVRAASAPTSGPEYILVDAVQETESAILLPYADGDTPGFQWTGTPGDSTSQKPIQPLIDAVTAVKPGGVLWTLVQSDAPLVNQYTRLFSAITVSLAAATIADVT